MTSRDRLADNFSRRELRGLGILATGGQVTKVDNDAFKVKSQTADKVYHVVKVACRWTCSCPDFLKKLKPCKHIFAVDYFLQLPSIMERNGYNIPEQDKTNDGRN